LNAYSDQPQAMFELYTLLHQNILDLFNEYGVQIMTPAYEGDPHESKVVPKERWYALPTPPDDRGRRSDFRGAKQRESADAEKSRTNIAPEMGRPTQSA
jgi:hypothetical protein